MTRQFRTGNHALVRELNRSIILNQLRTGPLSRADLAVRSGLNKTTVSSLVDELIADNFVRENGLTASAGGRPAVPLELNPAAGCSVGLEIGVGYLNVALTDFCGGVLWKKQVPVDESEDQRQIIKRAMTLVHGAVQRGQRTGTWLMGIGLVIPGLVDMTTGTVIYAPNLGWRNVPLGQIFSRKFDAPIFVDNDANAAALAEYYLGAAQEIDNYIYVVANAGIGAGLVFGRRVFHGAAGYAGEAGHMTLAHDGPPCPCGNRGCWERLASQSTVSERVQQAIQSGQPSSIAAPPEDSGGLCFQTILAAARQGDAVARQALEETGQYLGIGIANLVNTFNPQLVVLGGVLSLAEEFLTPIIRQTMFQRAMSGPRETAQFIVSKFKSDACLMGGIAIVLHDIFGRPQLDSAPTPQ